MIPRSLLITAAVLSLLLGACRRQSVEAYRIPKEKDPEMPMATASAAPAMGANAPATGAPMAAGNAMAGTPVATATGAELTWTAPADWKQKQASSMRKGSYSIPGNGGADGDFSITAFPGDVGGELANVNRWRGQVQLPGIQEGELASQVQRFEYNGLKIAVIDITGNGPNANRILGAAIPFGGATWFFKLSGPDAVVGGAKPAFLEFLKTIKPAAPTS